VRRTSCKIHDHQRKKERTERREQEKKERDTEYLVEERKKDEGKEERTA
jgi:hypothetical protein